MTELNKEEINLINNIAESYWQENNRNHIDNKEEWDLTLNLIKKLAIPNVSQQRELLKAYGFNKKKIETLKDK